MALPRMQFMARLTRDVEVRHLGDGMAIANVHIACSEKYGENETKLYLECVAFKKTAEMIARVSKGQRVYLFGKLNTAVWQDQQSGQNRYKTVFLIESFEFIEPKEQAHGQQNNSGYNQGYNQ